ncbi:tetratricopeptide repeat protein [Rhizobium brockwellii]|uniref:tetratricopeptide repeat protein n=1 Tax=Rhizobium brockwellii TaxID=3019932 RepID=UPI003F94814B
MARRFISMFGSGAVGAGFCVAFFLSAAVLRAEDDPLLKFSPEQPPPPARELNLFDVLQNRAESPLGEKADGLDSTQLAERAQNYLKGSGGRDRNPEEAAYWLRQLIIHPFSGTNSHSRWALETFANELLPTDPAKRDAVNMRKLQLIWELLALSGDGRAMCNLGFMYDEGIGVPRDLELARAWLERADTAGCAEARPALAAMK